MSLWRRQGTFRETNAPPGAGMRAETQRGSQINDCGALTKWKVLLPGYVTYSAIALGLVWMQFASSPSQCIQELCTSDLY